MQFFDSCVTRATTLTCFANISIVTANKIYYTMLRKHCAFEACVVYLGVVTMETVQNQVSDVYSY
jgi:hypothetical protein